MRIFTPIRLLSKALAAAIVLSLSMGVSELRAQSATPPAKPQDKSQDKSQDNPFPGDVPQAPAPQKPAASQSVPGSTTPQGSDAKPDANSGKPKSDNPFPGEDPNAPIIPVDPAAPGAPGAGDNPTRDREHTDQGHTTDSGADATGSPRRGADPDGDPVRSPDAAGNYRNDDGFSSSRSGLSAVPTEDDSDEVASKAARGKSSKQLIKENVDVGGFYLEKKNWKAAQARFSSAFALDAENPEAVWGLAESERHLQLYKQAEEHYKLFLSYEPEGRRGREARKALDEVEAARRTAEKTTGPAGGSNP